MRRQRGSAQRCGCSCVRPDGLIFAPTACVALLWYVCTNCARTVGTPCPEQTNTEKPNDGVLAIESEWPTQSAICARLPWARSTGGTHSSQCRLARSQLRHWRKV